MADRKQIGNLVSEARKELGYTQKKLTEITGINKSTLSEIENGRFTGSFDIFERYLDSVGLEFNVSSKKHQLPDWDQINELFGDDE